MKSTKFKSIVILLVFVILGHYVSAQKKELLQMREFYPLPGKPKLLETDISATAVLFASPDSIYFEIEVKDDVVNSSASAEFSDQIQISFALTDVEFNDYVIGEKGGKQFIFRNSIEAGDNADVEKFVKNGDYPSGKLKNVETGATATPTVPSTKSLKKQQLNFGITKFALFADGRKAMQLEREKYSAFENQMGEKLDDLSATIKYVSVKKPTGYHLSIAMSNTALGFGRVALMNNLKFVIDAIDADELATEVETVSSTPNRFTGRPSYFNKVVLPFSLNISLDGVPDAIIQNTGVKVEVYRAGNTWKPFTYNNGPIIYARDFLSESGLIEYVFFPQKMVYSLAEKPKCETLQIIYDDLALYNQHEYYFVINEQVLSSKDFRFSKTNANDFINKAFELPDGSVGIVLYDFEMVDPLGWGNLGSTADEFVFIQKLNAKESSTIFSIGMRIDAAETMTIGEENSLSLKNVKDVNFKWIEKGKTFAVQVKRIPSTFDEEVKFEIQPDLRIKQIN